MQLAIGEVFEGKVTGITKFGAFVELPGKATGMVHISEVSTAYVEDISQYLQEGQVVKVKIINITDEGKISLSIKKAMPPPSPDERPQQSQGFTPNRAPGGSFGGQGGAPSGGFRGGSPRGGGSFGGRSAPRFENKRPFNPQQMSSYEWSPRKGGGDSGSFEDMMNKFKQTSDDKISDLKKTRGDVKRGTANRKAKPE